MLPKYLEEAENLANKFLNNDNVMAMARPSTAGLSSLKNEEKMKTTKMMTSLTLTIS
jgi:hypothetical protein